MDKKIKSFTLAESAAHGIIVDDYRLNFPCHCEECHRHDEAISLGNNDKTKNMSFRGENDNLARRGNPGQKCRDKSAGLLRSRQSLAMTCNGKRKAAFTLAGAAHASFVNDHRRCAFTLAETLITLMVIGVVAALTIPALMQNINERALLKQRQTVAAKIAEGFANMRVAGDLETKYNSTAEFVNAMKKYFQISAVCNSNNLSACFAETITTTNEGEDVVNTVSEMKDVDKVIGLKLVDGTSMLIKYNPEAKGIEEGNTKVGKASIKGDEVTPATFEGLFEYKFDVNGSKSPNAQGKDMLGDLVIEKGGDPYGLGFEIINNTVYSSDTYKSSGTFCYYEDSCGIPDYWQGAKNYCESLGGSLPDKSQLDAIAQKLYPCPETIDEYGDYGHYCSPDTSNELWSVVGGQYVWSSIPYDDYDDPLAYTLAYQRSFFYEYGSQYWAIDRDYASVAAICVKK